MLCASSLLPLLGLSYFCDVVGLLGCCVASFVVRGRVCRCCIAATTFAYRLCRRIRTRGLALIVLWVGVVVVLGSR